MAPEHDVLQKHDVHESQQFFAKLSDTGITDLYRLTLCSRLIAHGGGPCLREGMTGVSRKVTVRDLTTHEHTESPWKYKDFCTRAAEEVKKCGVYIHQEPLVRPRGPLRLYPSVRAAGEVPGLPAKLKAAIQTPRLRGMHSRPGTSNTTCGSECSSPMGSSASHGISRPSRERAPSPTTSPTFWNRRVLAEEQNEVPSISSRSRRSKSSEVRSAILPTWKRWRAPPLQSSEPPRKSLKGLDDTEVVMYTRRVLLEETNAGLMGGAPFLAKPARRASSAKMMRRG
eukprot:s524_g5.t2